MAMLRCSCSCFFFLYLITKYHVPFYCLLDVITLKIQTTYLASWRPRNGCNDVNAKKF